MRQSSSHFSSNPSLQISPIAVPSPRTAMPAFDNKVGNTAQDSINRLEQVIGLLDNSLRLPNNPRAFMVYLVGLSIVFVGAFMHVMIAAQIMQAEFTLHQLQEEFTALEQQNGDIIFQIARDTNMTRLQQKVVEQGYVPVQEREYVFVPSDAIPSETMAYVTPDPEASIQAAEPVEASTQPTADLGIGQFAQWEEFWNQTWRSATNGATSASLTNALVPNKPSTKLQGSSSSPSFWSVWWEQASAQGSKLLDQFSGQ